MKLIEVTRHGGLKRLRLSVAAIAYFDDCEGGTAIRLIGGESLRVNEDCETIAVRVAEGAESPLLPSVTCETVEEPEPTTQRSVARKGKRR